ncbi:MAG TPA: prenyltransferase/squalene oxidase repeat-containing protein, partial [Tepidisphaeraceae bacterium]|nr:prenyltransferase/squalene oxidase repeat-containing protein [Tepidisphaeraceae bacterium]
MPNPISKIIVIASLALAPLAHADNTAAINKAQHLIATGLDYLKTQQQPDGSWQKSPYEPIGVTAIVLKAFVQEPTYSSKTPFLAHGFQKLLAYQLESGGIYKNSLACYNTAIAISALSAAHDPAFKPAIDKAVAYLKNLQWVGDMTTPDGKPYDKSWYGGWGYGGKKEGGSRPDLSNTQMALDALHDAGISKTDPAYEAAITFVSSLQNRQASNSAKWATNDGGFIYSPGPTGEGQSAAGAYTAPDGQRHLRSYGSMTYAGLKSFIYAGLSKQDPRVQAAFAWISGHFTLSENPGMAAMGPDYAKQGLYYYYMTLSRALHAYDTPTITDDKNHSHDWRVDLINKLASEQQADGSWSGEKRWMENNPVLVTAYSVLS